MSGVKKVGFVMHPLGLEDVNDFEPGAKGRDERLVKKVLSWMKEPFEIARLRLETTLGVKAEVIVQCVPRLPKEMLEDDEEIRGLVKKAARNLQEKGVSIIGLGAFTSIVGGGGREIIRGLDVPVTNGNAYTVSTAIAAVRMAAKKVGISLGKSKAVIVGATGSTGKACILEIASDVEEVVLVGKDMKKLEKVRPRELKNIVCSTDIRGSLKGAKVVISATNDPGTVIEPEYLESGCLVCDIARPRDVAESAVKKLSLIHI